MRYGPEKPAAISLGEGQVCSLQGSLQSEGKCARARQQTGCQPKWRRVPEYKEQATRSRARVFGELAKPGLGDSHVLCMLGKGRRSSLNQLVCLGLYYTTVVTQNEQCVLYGPTKSPTCKAKNSKPEGVQTRKLEPNQNEKWSAGTKR